MGIDVLVGSLSDLWRDETRERLALFAEAAPRMTDDPATFPSRKWRRRLAQVPTNEVQLQDVLAQLSTGKGSNIVDTVAAMQQERQRHHASEAEVRAAVDSFMSALRARLGDPMSWREELTSAEPAHVGNLAPNGMLALRSVATDLAMQTAPKPRGLDRVWQALRPEAHRERALRRRFPQLAWLDIDNVFLPVDVARVLGGFPHVVGSAPVLERELADVSKHSDTRLRDDAVKHNLEILGIAIAKATHRSVPMFIHG